VTARAVGLSLIAGLLAVVAAVLTELRAGDVALTAGMCAFHGASFGRDATIAASGIPAGWWAMLLIRILSRSVCWFRLLVGVDIPVGLLLRGWPRTMGRSSCSRTRSS